MTRLFRAAGGVIIRKTPKGNLKVLVAHRPRYDDWSFPKGKEDEGEDPAETAIREVLEETGYHCRIVAPLGTTRYRVGRGVKEVHWFAMRPLPDSPGFTKNEEVDKVRWLSKKSARKLLDYEHDQNLLKEANVKKLAQTGTLRLFRHAEAGDRRKWHGADDHARPLTKKGRKQAKAIANSLSASGIDRIVSSPYTRCVESVEPLAEATGATIEISEALAEDANVDAAYELVDSVVGFNAVLCTHGDVIPATINRLIWAGLEIHSRFYCSKGSIWDIDVVEGRFTEGRYHPPPAI